MIMGGGAATISLVAKPAGARTIWPNNAPAAVSLTYDDGYDSQLSNVIPLLNHLDIKATFFLTVENIDERLADWQAAAHNGHEIGNHTATHPCKLRDYSSERFIREQITPSEQYFKVNFPQSRPRCFAYPCGFEGLGKGRTDQRVRRYQNAIAPSFLAARTVNGEPNNPAEVYNERYSLRGYEPTYEVDDPGKAFAYLRQARSDGFWAILVFHEVLGARKGDGDTSKAVHAAIVEHIAHHKMWCAPVRDVFEHVTRVT
jgi:peptidoglycan/xylan/chitin deacetylase (PgdA/CDA1 family)